MRWRCAGPARAARLRLVRTASPPKTPTETPPPSRAGGGRLAERSETRYLLTAEACLGVELKNGWRAFTRACGAVGHLRFVLRFVRLPKNDASGPAGPICQAFKTPPFPAEPLFSAVEIHDDSRSSPRFPEKSIATLALAISHFRAIGAQF